ncbi:MAG: type II site-specific deoxyribonuclease [Candidatus Frackibacter sp. T328-2]|nr:MAG: type II site-specific deoxyribonuclease [Candidatus Frackibacter sp. T328-2]
MIKNNIKKVGRGLTNMSSRSATRGYSFEFMNIIKANERFNCKIPDKTKKWCHSKGQKKFNALEENEKNEMVRASEALMDFIEGYEDWIDETVYIERVSSQGGSTDVRDIRFIKKEKDNTIQLEVGISLKSNNDAVKHQRISPNIDIGKEWLGFAADDEYINNINNFFNNFSSYCQRNNINKFKELDDKSKLLYEPLCTEVANYLDRAFAGENGVEAMRNFITYLIGSRDFYKAQANFNEGELIIRSFNFRDQIGTGDLLELPTKCYESIPKKSSRGNVNRVFLAFNNGWETEMRLHNAESKITNSLKFDTRLVGIPHNAWQTRINF